MGKQPIIRKVDGHQENVRKSALENLKIGSWNIKRGLVTKEIELRQILIEEEFYIIFLNETDTKQILSEKDYQIDGYETILPKLSKTSQTVRILVLVENDLLEFTKCAEQMISTEFPQYGWN